MGIEPTTSALLNAALSQLSYPPNAKSLSILTKADNSGVQMVTGKGRSERSFEQTRPDAGSTSRPASKRTKLNKNHCDKCPIKLLLTMQNNWRRIHS